MNNPYILRSAFGSHKGIPKVVSYLKNDMGAKKVAVAWVNSEFGKGGHDAFLKEAEAAGLEIMLDVAPEQAQSDFAADVLKLKGSSADVIFVYYRDETGELSRDTFLAKVENGTQTVVKVLPAN